MSKGLSEFILRLVVCFMLGMLIGSWQGLLLNNLALDISLSTVLAIIVPPSMVMVSVMVWIIQSINIKNIDL